MRLAAAVVLAVAVAGCTTPEGRSEGAAPATADFLTLARAGGDQLDEDPIIFASLDQLLSRSDLVAVGSVTRTAPGRTVVDEEGNLVIRTFTFELRLDRVINGTPSPGESVTLEWYAAPGLDDAELGALAKPQRLLIGARLIPNQVEGGTNSPDSLAAKDQQVLMPWEQAFLAEGSDGRALDAGSSDPATVSAVTKQLGVENFDGLVELAAQRHALTHDRP